MSEYNLTETMHDYCAIINPMVYFGISNAVQALMTLIYN